MNQKITQYLKKLKQYGIENDIPNVTECVGQFLNMLIQIKNPKTILEIGCANGYSTIWMAEAAKKVGARIVSIDHSRPTFEEAKKNLAEVELDSVVDFYFGDAVELISQFSSDQRFDFVFVDGEKASYLDFWKIVEGCLSDTAIIVFDDMIAFPKKTKAFSDYLKTLSGFDQLLLPIDDGDGILILMKYSSDYKFTNV